MIDAILTSSSTGYKSEEPDWLSRKSDFEEIPANDPHPFRKIDPNGVKSFLDTAFNVADKVMGTTGQGKTWQKGLQIRLPSYVIFASLQLVEHLEKKCGTHVSRVIAETAYLFLFPRGATK